MPRLMAILFAAVVVFGSGCGGGSGGVFSSGEHAHERDKMLLADAGNYHAGLTAHLSSKTGNELDILFETADDAHKPVPLPLTGFTATAKASDGGEQVLEFKPAPKDERKTDPDGKCSHFVATAAWMKPDDKLTITATVEIDGKKERIEWKDFNPKKYAHVEE
ncbi:MAG TPA: hypothetical protein VKE74_32100 [Gemmataceae bacterium]|nr:hypothetical protein [Gemmataceae bacterium]